MGTLEETLAASDAGKPQATPGAPPEVPLPDAATIAAAQDREKWIAAAVNWGPVVKGVLPEKCRAACDLARYTEIGNALADVAAHYGWKFSNAMGHPLLKLAGACAPIAWPLIEPYAMQAMGQLTTTNAPPQAENKTAATESPPETAPGPKPKKIDPIG